jgi:hypothetical protein
MWPRSVVAVDDPDGVIVAVVRSYCYDRGFEKARPA